MFALAVVFAFSVGANAFARNLPEVTLKQGTARGFIHKTINGREFEAYFGIPYAKPPVGEYRFKAAEPREPWAGLWNATEVPNSCIQIDFFSNNVVGAEDCLYVNVFTPKATTTTALDVLVFIHGGGFQFLTGAAYGPEYIMDKDVIYVTFNYRLGVMGFLSFEDDDLPGNNGLKDQNLALKWVNENIAAFGGDPGKITISGMSAGGASVHYHLLSKKSKGLFQKAILNSGAVSNPWALSERVAEKSLQLADELGCLIGKSSQVLDCMRERPAEWIVKLSNLARVGGYVPISPIGPMIEKPSPAAFIDRQPYNIIESGEAIDVPILWSYNSDEGLFPGAKMLADTTGEVDKSWDNLLPHLLEFNFTARASLHTKISHKVREHYLGDKTIRNAPGNFTKLLGDRYFYIGIQQAAKLHAQYSKSPNWAYIFNYVGGMRTSDLFHIDDVYKGGACHGDDTHYVLRAVYSPVDRRPEDRQMIATMTDVWLNFMKGSMPSSWNTIKTGLPDYTFLDIADSDMSKNTVKTVGKTSGQELWLSFKLGENSEELIRQSEHTEL